MATEGGPGTSRKFKAFDIYKNPKNLEIAPVEDYVEEFELYDEPFLLAPRGTKPSRRAASASIMVDIAADQARLAPGFPPAMKQSHTTQRSQQWLRSL